MEEQRATLLLVVLADRACRSTQTIERAQEAAVLLVRPAHVAGPAPTVRPQPVEPAVVPGAERGVRLDVVARQLAETRPGVEEARPSRDHCGDGISIAERTGERGERVRRFCIEDRLGWACAGQIDGTGL